MLFSNKTKVSLCVGLSVLMTNIPAMAAMDRAMIATGVVAEHLNPSSERQDLQDFINRDDVKKILLERGISADEASVRLANLSTAELKQLSGQIKQAKAGGDILVTILLIVLIIYLVKRI